MVTASITSDYVSLLPQITNNDNQIRIKGKIYTIQDKYAGKPLF